jgi:hypothetical protein
MYLHRGSISLAMHFMFSTIVMSPWMEGSLAAGTINRGDFTADILELRVAELRGPRSTEIVYLFFKNFSTASIRVVFFGETTALNLGGDGILTT